jgi:hypothetical protein
MPSMLGKPPLWVPLDERAEREAGPGNEESEPANLEPANPEPANPEPRTPNPRTGDAPRGASTEP